MNLTLVLGIPFAEPPTESLRFMPPQKVQPWNGTLDVSKKPTVYCVQPNYFDPSLQSGQEDCLYLNVYTPVVSNVKTLFPVMVWIFGGGFQYGSGTWDEYGPDMFMDTKEVVMVNHSERG